jgi:DNA-binding MarR family transcriptional regulator
MTAAQMSIMTLFNEGTVYEFSDILSRLNMKADTASNALQPMVKATILNVTEGSLDGPDCTLVLNEKFQK